VNRPTRQRNRSRYRRIRPWIVPLLFVGFLFSMYSPDFDLGALRSELTEGDLDDALSRLSTTPREQLDPDIASVRWWPAEARRLRFALIDVQVREDPYESLSLPTLVAPLDAHRDAPTAFRLREAVDHPLVLLLTNLDLDMEVVTLELPAGTSEIETDVSLLAGMTFVMSLMEKESQEQIALAAFEILPHRVANAIGIAMRNAHQLAPDDDSGNLLAGIVALHYELHAEAIARFEQLEDLPRFTRVARELKAIALAEQGLDRTALALIEGDA
jgi:hypothetical protein